MGIADGEVSQLDPRPREIGRTAAELQRDRISRDMEMFVRFVRSFIHPSVCSLAKRIFHVSVPFACFVDTFIDLRSTKEFNIKSDMLKMRMSLRRK